MGNRSTIQKCYVVLNHWQFHLLTLTSGSVQHRMDIFKRLDGMRRGESSIVTTHAGAKSVTRRSLTGCWSSEMLCQRSASESSAIYRCLAYRVRKYLQPL